MICHYTHLFLWYALFFSLSKCRFRNLVRSKFYHDWLENVIVSWNCQTQPFFLVSQWEIKIWGWTTVTKISFFPRGSFSTRGFCFPFLRAVIGTSLVTVCCENLWLLAKTQETYATVLFSYLLPRPKVCFKIYWLISAELHALVVV